MRVRICYVTVSTVRSEQDRTSYRDCLFWRIFTSPTDKTTTNRMRAAVKITPRLFKKKNSTLEGKCEARKTQTRSRFPAFLLEKEEEEELLRPWIYRVFGWMDIA